MLRPLAHGEHWSHACPLPVAIMVMTVGAMIVIVVVVVITVMVVMVIVCRSRSRAGRSKQQPQPDCKAHQKPIHGFLLVMAQRHHDSPPRNDGCRDKLKRKDQEGAAPNATTSALGQKQTY